ncbi:hypothetical protein [Phormidesmis sp. 146-33]
MKVQTTGWLTIILLLLALSGCAENTELIPQTRCNRAVAIATQTWEVDYYISKTSGDMNTQRTHAFQSNTITNLNGEKPANAATGPDDNGIWWAALPPRPTADEVDQHRETQERNDPPMLQRSVDYHLRCETGMLLTDAQTYREAARAIRLRQSVSVTYLWNRVMKVKNESQST